MRLTRSQFSSAGLEVSHLCHRKLCINPMHLTLESHDTNQERIHCVLQGFCFEVHQPMCMFWSNFWFWTCRKWNANHRIKNIVFGFFPWIWLGTRATSYVSDIALLPDVFRKVYTISNPICAVSLRFFIFFLDSLSLRFFSLMFLRLGHRRE